jgi:hypothetical protein
MLQPAGAGAPAIRKLGASAIGVVAAQDLSAAKELNSYMVPTDGLGGMSACACSYAVIVCGAHGVARGQARPHMRQLQDNALGVARYKRISRRIILVINVCTIQDSGIILLGFSA